MADPLTVNSISTTDEDEITWHDPPSSPFVSHIEFEDQENVPPTPSAAGSVAPTPVKLNLSSEENVPQSAIKITSPEKKFALKNKTSPTKQASPSKQLPHEDEQAAPVQSFEGSPKKNVSPVKPMAVERPESAMSSRSRRSVSPAKSSRPSAAGPVDKFDDSLIDAEATPLAKRPIFEAREYTLRDNEGLTVAMKMMEQTRTASFEAHTSTTYTGTQQKSANVDDTEFHPDGPDGPELTSLDVDDTGFSILSEMPNLDMTKFAMLRQSPTKQGMFGQATPRPGSRGVAMTPATARRGNRTPSPTPRGGGRTYKDNDTTNLILDFTAQMESFSMASQGSPRRSPSKHASESNLLSYMNNQRSPQKGAVPCTPSQKRPIMNLLDFELPPAPTPRSIPTVTIRELESLKSNLQSQISSLQASLSGKEAEVESLVKAVSGAERRVGEAQEALRDEKSAREHAESQMEDWKKKGEEVQNILQDVQAELARNDAEREDLLKKLSAAEARIEEVENRAHDAEARVVEAEGKAVDMTTFIDTDPNGPGKRYSEKEVQDLMNERVNEVARELHSAYKAKHEQKVRNLRENYQVKAEKQVKVLQDRIGALNRQIESLEKKKDDTFSKVLPPELKVEASTPSPQKEEKPTHHPDDLKKIEELNAEIENLKAKVAGLNSELRTLCKTNSDLQKDLEAERVEKGELVAAAEQMLQLCSEKMGDLAQEELRKSTLGGGPPVAAAAAAAAAAPPPRPASGLDNYPADFRRSGNGSSLPAPTGGSGIARPSGLKGPGFGLNRSVSGGKSRLMSNLERMGGAGRPAQKGDE